MIGGEYYIVVESIVACEYTDVSETTEDSVTSDGRGMTNVKAVKRSTAVED